MCLEPRNASDQTLIRRWSSCRRPRYLRRFCRGFKRCEAQTPLADGNIRMEGESSYWRDVALSSRTLCDHEATTLVHGFSLC